MSLTDNWLLSGAFEFSQRHTTANIINTTKEILEKWDISLDKVVAVVSDGASNITKTAKDLFGEKVHVYCSGHLLNVVLNHAFHANQEIYPVLKKIQDIVTWFRSSSIAHYALKGMSELCLLNWTPTKWNSAYIMLKRFAAMIQSINAVLLEHEEAPSVLTAAEILSVKEIIPILEIFFYIATEVSAEKQVTISKLLAIQDYMLTSIESKDPVVISELKKRLSDFQSSLVIGLPSLLDPRYKKTHFEPNHCANVVSWVNRYLTSVTIVFVMNSKIQVKRQLRHRRERLNWRSSQNKKQNSS